MRLLRKILAPCLLLPALAVPGAAQVSSVDELHYPPLREFEIPQPVRVELENGMVLMLLEDHELPLVDAVARIRTGARYEAAAKVGLAGLTGQVLRTGGTTSMNGDEMDDFLEGRAASIETSIGVESGSASMSCLVEDLPDVLALFADVLRHPVFDEEKLAVAKNQLRSSIARQNDDPQNILFREFDDIVYGDDSPYARNATYASVAAISRDDLVAWHERFFHPNNVILGLVGDFDTGQAVALVRAVFGDWERGDEAPAFEGGYGTEPVPGVFYVEKNDMTQSNIAIGHLGIRRDNPDYYAVEVLNEVFSGGFASRLFSNVRSKKGLAYAVRGGVGSEWDHDGVFQMWMTTKTETTGAGIEALLEEADRLTAEPPTDDEVEKAKASILNSFVFNSDSPDKVLRQQLTYEYFGYPLDWLGRYAEGIRGITTAQVRDVAGKYIFPDRYSILVVGPAEGRDRPLDEFGPVTAVDITIPEPTAERAEATEESLAAGKALLDRVVEAMGGKEGVAALEALHQKATMSADTPQGPMQLEAGITLVYPSSVRQELVLPFGTMVVVATADAGFQQSPQGTQPLPDEQRHDALEGVLRNPAVFLRRYLEGGVQAVALADDRAEVTVDGTTFELEVDPASGLPASITYLGSHMMTRAPGEVTQRYSDFRQVDGLSFPFAVEATFDGQPYFRVEVQELTVNPPLEEGLFEMPQPE